MGDAIDRCISDDQDTVDLPEYLCSNVCAKQLMKYSKKIEMLYKTFRNDIKVARAYAYYNAPLM